MKIILVVLTFVLTVANNAFSDTRVVVISDMNSGYGSKDYHPAVAKSIEQIAKIKPDLAISTGDMVAGQKAGLDYAGMWDAFHSKVSNPLSVLGIPLAVTPGNHDGSGEAAFKLERELFISQWKSKDAKLQFVDQDHYPIHYAFSVKKVLFVSIDATMVGRLSKVQKIWLKEVLTKNNHYPHVVVFGHLPIFPITELKTNEFIDDQELIKIMQENNVDLYLSGHHHAYYPGIHQRIRQISQGCLGAGPRKILGTTAAAPRSMTVIDFHDDGNITVEAYSGSDLDKLINRKGLPEKIQYKDRQMIRDDL